jgi:hypothetical protein
LPPWSPAASSCMTTPASSWSQRSRPHSTPWCHWHRSYSVIVNCQLHSPIPPIWILSDFIQTQIPIYNITETDNLPVWLAKIPSFTSDVYRACSNILVLVTFSIYKSCSNGCWN